MSLRKVQLSERRERWAAQRAQAHVFKGAALAHNAAVASRYVTRLQALTAQMTAQTNKEIRKLFEGDAAHAFFAQDARSIGSEARILINSLQARFNDLFASRARKLAEAMVGQADKVSAGAMKTTMEKISGGLSIKPIMDNPIINSVRKASVAENVGLIKSIAQEYLNDVQGAVMRSITTGNGLQDLVPALSKYEGQTHRRARNIALDQTRKAYNTINKARMQSSGFKRYEWLHSGGSNEPRPHHVEMNGNIYSFDDPPVIDPRTGERGIPGQAPFCRCTMRPIFDFEFVGEESTK